MEEIWRDIPDYPGYQVSNLGNVQSYLKRNYKRYLTPHPLKPHPGRGGRLNVGLSKNGKLQTRYIHRLVLSTFVGPCPPGMQACHNDGNALNNHVENLRWDTQLANAADRRIHDPGERGERKASARMTEAKVLDLRERFVQGWTYRELAEYYGIDYTTVAHIVRGETWAHIGGPIVHCSKRRKRIPHVVTPNSEECKTLASRCNWRTCC
jgi:hypothetical protein